MDSSRRMLFCGTILVLLLGACGGEPMETEVAPERNALALHTASEAGDLAEVRALLESGYDPNLETHTGVTPMMLAVSRGHREIVRQLIEAGADLDRPDPGTGMPPIAIAAFQGKERIVEDLLAAGADPARPDSAGFTALDYAEQASQSSIAHHLRRAMEPGSPFVLPSGWNGPTRFDTSTRHWLDIAALPIMRDPADSRRFLIRSSVEEQAQIFLIEGDSAFWIPRIETAGQELRGHPLLVSAEPLRIETADGVVLDLTRYRISAGVLAGREVEYLLGGGELSPGRMVIVDAGGRPESGGAERTPGILRAARVRSVQSDLGAER